MSNEDDRDQDAILDVRDLSVSYRTTKAVDGVSLHINRGEIFGLLGPNGAGKTSTLSAIEGLLKPGFGDGPGGWRRCPPTPGAGEIKDGRATSVDQLPGATQHQTDRPAVRRALRCRHFRKRRSTKASKPSGSSTTQTSSSSSSPADSSSGFRSSSPSSMIRCCSFWTSRPPDSIRSRVVNCGRAWSTCVTREAASFSPPTRWRKPKPSVTGSPSSTTATCWPPVHRTN